MSPVSFTDLSLISIPLVTEYIPLFINDQSADLLSKDGYTYKPLNPNDINFNIEKPLWGSFKLSRNQMVKGNLFFKVNKTFDPQTFEWKESDRVIINFSQ